MLRLMKNFKMLLKKLVIASGVASLLGCASGLPKPPDINLYIHNQPKAVALCTKTAGGSCSALPISQTHKFYMVSPPAWEAMQNYIDALIRQIMNPSANAAPPVLMFKATAYGDAGEERMEALTQEPWVPIAVKDLHTARRLLISTETRLKQQIR